MYCTGLSHGRYLTGFDLKNPSLIRLNLSNENEKWAKWTLQVAEGRKGGGKGAQNHSQSQEHAHGEREGPDGQRI